MLGLIVLENQLDTSFILHLQLFVDNLLLLFLELLLLTKPLLVVFLNKLFLLHLVLDFRLLIDIIGKSGRFLHVNLCLSLDYLVNVELEALRQHLVQHCDLVGVGVDMMNLGGFLRHCLFLFIIV